MGNDNGKARRLLKLARNVRGLSQEALAADMRKHGHSGWTQDRCSNAENGSKRCRLRVDELRDLAVILSLSDHDLAAVVRGI